MGCKYNNCKICGYKSECEIYKENAELKTELSENKVADCHIVNGLCEQLTKAKEIIKYLLSFIQKENYRTRWDINIKEAEQFLNSEVEK